MSDIVIAARGGPAAKTRFASRLDARDRDRLTTAMIEAMLVLLRDSGLRVWVVSPTPALLALAREYGARPILQERGTLNDAFELGLSSVLEARSAGHVALLPGDLPLLDARELFILFDALSSHDIAVAPALHDGGTGALGLKHGLAFQPRFGVDSFRAHIELARVLSLKAAVVHAPSLGADIDRPDELRAVLPDIAAGPLPASLKQRFVELGHTATRRETA